MTETPLYFYNKVLDRSGGIAYVRITDADEYYNVIEKIWEKWRLKLAAVLPSADFSWLELVHLKQPVAILPQDTFIARMEADRDQGATTETVHRLGEILLEYPDIRKVQSNKHIVFELKINVPGPADIQSLNIVAQARHNALEALRKPTSSSQLNVASSTKELASERSTKPLCNGRPARLSGMPISLYNPVFAQLKHDLGRLDATEPPPAIFIKTVCELFDKSCDIFPGEAERQNATFPILEKLLSVAIDDKQSPPGSGTFHQADGFTLAALGVSGITVGDTVPCVLFEAKNELGQRGASDIQLGMYYKKQIVQAEYKRICDCSCFPTILVSIAGPYIRFYGAAMAEVPLFQPFVDYISLAGDPDVERRVEYVAKVLYALRTAIRNLKDWYKCQRFDRPVPSCLAPTFAPDHSLDGLTIQDRLDYPGRVDGKGRADVRRALFRGTLRRGTDDVPVRVVVKFCFRYGKQVHAALAARKRAPALYFCAPLLCGVTMVVMQHVENGEIAQTKYDRTTLPETVMKDIADALETLRSRGFVHGDVRRPNIVVFEDAGEPHAMLLDFDWAGVDGQVFYPARLNTTGMIEWARGVAPKEPIKTEHDIEMMELLQKIKL